MISAITFSDVTKQNGRDFVQGGIGRDSVSL